MSKSINDAVADAMLEIAKARESVEPFNDFGSICGFKDEMHQIEEDMMFLLQRMAWRATRLSLRARKFKSGEREVPLISDFKPV